MYPEHELYMTEQIRPMNRPGFPLREVATLTGTTDELERQQNFAEFAGLSGSGFLRLLKLEAAHPSGRHGLYMPTHAEIAAAMAADAGSEWRFAGYVVYPPRRDARVNVTDIEIVTSRPERYEAWSELSDAEIAAPARVEMRAVRADEMTNAPAPDGRRKLTLAWS